jgi:hypothetical protein
MIDPSFLRFGVFSSFPKSAELPFGSSLLFSIPFALLLSASSSSIALARLMKLVFAFSSDASHFLFLHFEAVAEVFYGC